MTKIYVPPIKSQGIKTKLVPWINSIVWENFKGMWIEPFMGTGVVAFNLAPKNALLCDTNPHLINFYSSIQSNDITPCKVKTFLTAEGAKLLELGESHYYYVRNRFNNFHDPLDFLFLSRAGFNGMIRFNKKGGFNVPFCKKPNRFAQAYVTKIVNQVSYVQHLLKTKNFIFKCQDFKKTIVKGSDGDLIYCDPPYIARHTDYYNSWDSSNEDELFLELSNTTARFILSTWHHNDFRKNEFIDSHWNRFNLFTRKHFYHVGGSEKNRNPMIEAIVTNYKALEKNVPQKEKPAQLSLFEKSSEYCLAG